MAEGLLKVHLRPSREGSRPEAPSLPAHLLLCWAVGSGVGGWTLQPAGLLGGSDCPFAAPRMAWFLGQPPVLRVLPVPPQILWVQPPGAALGWPVTRSVCVLCQYVCLVPALQPCRDCHLCLLLGAALSCFQTLPSWQGCWSWGHHVWAFPTQPLHRRPPVVGKGHGFPHPHPQGVLTCPSWCRVSRKARPPSDQVPPLSPGHLAPPEGQWLLDSTHNQSQHA